MKPSTGESPAKEKAARAAVITAVIGVTAALSVVFVLHTTSRRVTRDLQDLTQRFTSLPSVTAPVQQSTSGVPDPRSTTAAPTTAPTTAAPTAATSAAGTEPTAAPATTAPPQTVQTIQNESFVPPVNGDVIKPFSPRQPLFSTTMGDWRTHSGVDFAAEEGAEVHAVGNGVVKMITADARRGYVIEIDHGEFTARYCSLNQNGAVKNGSTVAAGDVIGTLATPPIEQADAPHLHFETLRDGAFIDPLKALGLG
ncbi:MAG: M23 family metallopeptidase [Clostridia bacterium]|nr:M23 family metallopeptidase [Clostridia bacterium]